MKLASLVLVPPFVALLTVCALPGAAVAAGRIALSWHGCSPIVSTTPSDGAHPYSAFVSVTGHGDPHKAYQWTAYLRRDPWTGSIPDAWRFDAPGCQGSSLVRIDHTPSAAISKSCPAFQGVGTQSLQIKDVAFDPTSGRIRIVLASTYSPAVTTVDPNVRYFLGRIEFDHTYSVPGAGVPAETCGGFETDMRLSLLSECLDPRFCSPSSARWVDLDGEEHAWEIENPTLTFCGSCGPTPALPSTWGLIKGRYRH